MKKRRTRNEFRYNHFTDHINYVFEEDDENYHSLGLTTKKRTFDLYKRKWHNNMPLKNNPKRNDKRKAYIRYGVITQNKKSFANNVDKRFKFSKNDYSNVKSKIRNYKKRRKKT